MKNNMFKATEKTLYNYKNLNLEVESLNIHINSILNDVSIAGVSYEERTAPTNAFSSRVENEVIRRDEHLSKLIEKLKHKKQKLIELEQIIKIALSSLEPEEYKLVELRYFIKPKKTWVEVCMILGIDIATCHRMKNKIINNLSNFIYPM